PGSSLFARRGRRNARPAGATQCPSRSGVPDVSVRQPAWRKVMSRAPYEQHFGLDANPFSMAPDPDFLYMSAQHEEALAHLLYGLDTDGGFVLLIGAAGIGKTTVCRCLLRELPDG